MAQLRKRPGGTYINIVVGVIFFGLLGLAAWWVIKSLGEAGEQYIGVAIDTKYQAETVKCQMNLRTVSQNLKIYAISNEQFPPSFDELMNFCGGSQLFRCEGKEKQQYKYIPGQNPDMPGTNVVMYESQPAHDEKCAVLFLNGYVELLTPDQLKIALARTQAELSGRSR